MSAKRLQDGVTRRVALRWAGSIAVGCALRGWGADRAGRGRIVCATTDLASLVKEVGGERFEVFCLAKGPEDPHTLEVRPSFVRELERASLFVQVGLGIENAWLKDLMGSGRNASVRPGGTANLNLGRGVRPLEGLELKAVPGSFHEEGNPHYLLDPVEGLKAARTIATRLSELQPALKEEFEKRYEDFRLRLGSWLVGEECAKHDDVEALALLVESTKPEGLPALLKEHRLSGFLEALMPHRGRAVVGDHDLWPYFARRCGLEILGYLEPSPGVPPTPRHLQDLVSRMKERKVGILLSNPYFEPRHAEFVARATGARIVPMAHQTEGRPGAGSYLEMLKYNGRQLLEALAAKP